MTTVLKNRVKETSTTTGTGSYTLLGAVAGFQSFSVIGNGNTCFYTAWDPVSNDWEVGIGTWATGGTLARTVVLASSNSGAAVSWAAGTRNIWVDAPAEKFVNHDDVGLAAGYVNKLINPDGRINQRGPSTNTDNTYGHDGWVVLTQTAAIAVNTQVNLEDGLPRVWRLTQSQATAQRMGYVQWIEGQSIRHLRGKNVTLSGRIRYSLNAAVRYAVCEWTGTEDTPGAARDIVNSWTNGTFTAGQFFKSTTFNVLGVGTITPAANTLTDLTSLTVAVGSSMTNLVVFIWTEGTAAQNHTLDAAIQLEVGSFASDREVRSMQSELDLCERYFEKSEALTTPVGNAGSNFFVVVSFNPAAAQYYYQVYFRKRKRIAPAITTYPYTTPANTGRSSNGSGTDYGALSAEVPSGAFTDVFFAVRNGTAGALTVTQGIILFGWYADASI